MPELRDVFDALERGVMFGRGSERFDSISTDTRGALAGSLFVALRGERFDGHDFIEQALSGGAAACLFESAVRVRPPAIRVPDTRRALGEMARGWRRRHDLPVVAVTGSNGKTTVKEMVAAIFSAAVGDEATLATRGNFNNDIGVPLTVYRLGPAHRLAVIELGMNHPGEIAWLAAIARPTVALVNNAQREHQEFLSSVAATAIENGAAIAALPADGVAVFPGDDPCASIWRELAGTRQIVTFGLSDTAGSFDVQANGDASPGAFAMQVGGATLTVGIAIDGVHNVRNALAAAACALAAGVSLESIRTGLERFRPANGRMRRVSLVPGLYLIDDTYNANPDSVRAAIDALAVRPAPRVLVLGDMAEIGENGPLWHAEIGEHARSSGVTRLLALGELTRETVRAFGSGAEHFAAMPAICAAACAAATGGTSMLVKGSRAMKMEAVVDALGKLAARVGDDAGDHAGQAGQAGRAGQTGSAEQSAGDTEQSVVGPRGTSESAR